MPALAVVGGVFFAYCAHDLLDSANHVDPFGQLFLSTEIALYGLSKSAAIAGLLALMLVGTRWHRQKPSAQPRGRRAEGRQKASARERCRQGLAKAHGR